MKITRYTVSLVTTTFIPHTSTKYPYHTHLCTWSVHLIYTTSTYLYPIPHYINHTAYPHTSHTLTHHSSPTALPACDSVSPYILPSSLGGQWTTRVHLLVCVGWVVMDTMHHPKLNTASPGSIPEDLRKGEEKNEYNLLLTTQHQRISFRQLFR